MSRRLLVIVSSILAASAASVLTYLWVRSAPPVSVELPTAVRIADREGGRRELEVPIVRYVSNGASPAHQVDFIGAVHVGESAYYRALNDRFKGYDVVLFELIAEPGAVAQMGTKGRDSTLGSIQRTLSGLLGLSFQLDEIDYQAPNFVHADLTPGGLKAAMQARGETMLQLLFRLVKLSFDPKLQESLRKAGLDDRALDGINPVMIALRGPTEGDRHKFKRFLAQGLAASDRVMEAFMGETGTVIIADRNSAALAVLQQQLDAGKKRVAIFYGAAHLPDMDMRLVRDFSLVRTNVEWLPAWSFERKD
jgi:hypothetical protein